MSNVPLVDVMTLCGLTGPSWWPWRTVAKVLDAQPLDADEHRLFERCTGRMTPPTIPPREVYLICGRRSGKSRFAGALAVRSLAFTSYAMAPGEKIVTAIAASDREQARLVLGYATSPFREQDELRPLVQRPTAWQSLRSLVARETRWTLDTTLGTSIEVTTAIVRAPRGRTFSLFVGDEVAYWPQNPDASDPAHEVLRAVRPGLATTRGPLIIITTPFLKSGPVYDAFAKFYGVPDERVLVWNAPSIVMNPTLDPAEIQAALDRDPEGAKAEWLAQFREDVSALVGPDALRRVARPTSPADETLWPPHDGEPLVFVDGASGSGSDSFAVGLAVATHDDSGRLVAHVLDVHESRPPFDPAAVVAELGQACRDIGVSRVYGDGFALGWLGAMCRGAGLEYAVADLTKSQLYTQLLVLINSRHVSLPNEPRLLAQLAGLIRKPTAGGHDSVDHHRHQHDDVANVAAGAAVLAHRLAARAPVRVW